MVVSVDGVATPGVGTARGLTEARIQRWCLWCGPAFVLVFFGGIVLAGWVPPPSPGQSADQVAAMYAAAPDRLRAAFVLIFLAGGVGAPFVLAIHHELRRIEGAGAMALLQVMAGAMSTVIIAVPAMVFMAAAYRPERAPEITQALHDTAMIPFIGNFVPFLVQSVAIAVAILAQDPATARLPRWLGWFNLWVGFLVLPGLLLIFFRHGAFAWNGLLVFWLAGTVFVAWFVVMFDQLRRLAAAEASL